MTEIKNETGTKKKLLIPVVVLMLLGVSLAGAAYAYSSSLTVNNNAVVSQDLTIDLSSGAGSISASGIKAVTFTDNISYEWNSSANPAAYVKYNLVKGEANSGLAFTYDLNVSGTAPASSIVVKATDITAYYATAIGSTTIGALYKIYVNSENNIATATELAANATEYDIDISKTGSSPVTQSVYVFVKAVGNTPVTVHAKDVYNASWEASTYNAAVAAAAFTMSFEAVE